MLLSKDKENEILMKDVHCPYCNEDHAILLSKTESKKLSFQLPAYGLKFIFSLIYLAFVQILIYGYKTFEVTKKINTITYAFCSCCGNSYSLAPPQCIQEETEEPKFCRIREGKVCMGICTGISKYTGISLLWIRIMTIIYFFTVIGALAYFLIGACVPFEEDLETGIHCGRLYRVKKGRDLTGLCKGISEYTDIPVAWVRFFAILSIITIWMPILYFILTLFIPLKENVEAGKIRKKLYKVHNKKILFGLCAGLAEYTGASVWIFRIIGILFFPIYVIMSAIIPTKEEDDAK